VIGYFPDGNAVFGGCLIKEMNATKGFLGDANLTAWPETVQKLKQKYPNTKIVIPGHGKSGGSELFDYTIQLFRQQ
jgi:metallo-beta-lactamase class B